MTINLADYRNRGGVLVPAALPEEPITVDYTPASNLPVPAKPSAAEKLYTDLAAKRAEVEVKGADEIDTAEWNAYHARRKADLAERVRLEEISRKRRTQADEQAARELARDENDKRALARLYREAMHSGARAHVRTRILESAEMRALRIEQVRKMTLRVGVPILVAFAAWSTAGVQAGVVKLLGLATESTGWWASWSMEPALMAIVVLIIIGRAMLRSSGGATDRRADVIEGAALLTSVALNMAGGWDSHLGFGQAVGAALAHSVGPLGAAGTAYLIGVFDSYVSAARPWDGAQTLEQMGLVAVVPGAPASKIELPETQAEELPETERPRRLGGRTPGPRDQAERMWRDSCATGRPLTGAALAAEFGMSSSWGGDVINAARAKDATTRKAS